MPHVVTTGSGNFTRRGEARTKGIAQVVLAANRRGKANRLTSGGEAVATIDGQTYLTAGLVDGLYYEDAASKGTYPNPASSQAAFSFFTNLSATPFIQ
jgi:hypothetical protein